MARYLRPHLPGSPFHLTARLQGRAPLFAGVEASVVRWINERGIAAGFELLAYAIMPNHLHLVVVQGAKPLGHFMQPLLRRLAVFLHARHGTEGHVFQRRYYSAACTDPDYLRNVIAYVHLNPVRARLCARLEQYAWTTHERYCGVVEPRAQALPGLALFCPEPGASVLKSVDNYRAFLAWRRQLDAAGLDPTQNLGRRLPLQPPTTGGDVYWLERFGSHCFPGAESARARKPQMDIRDYALRVLRRVAPDMTLDVLRSGERTRSLVAVRREFIQRAKESGYRQRAIARFLNVSDVTVSRS